MAIFTKPPPVASPMYIEVSGQQVMNPIWVKWFTDLSISLREFTVLTTPAASGINATLGVDTGTATFENGILTGFTGLPELP